MTYTLVVVLAVLLARGTVSGRDASPRMLLTAGIMFVPQLGVGVFVLLLSLGHIGAACPYMLIYPLVLEPLMGPTKTAMGAVRRGSAADLGADRRSARSPRGRGASARGGVAVAPSAAGRDGRGGLAVAAILAKGLASLVDWLLRASGDFIWPPVGVTPAAPRAWPSMFT